MKIFDYEEIKMNWDSFTYPIAVGTPVSVDGVLADNSSAHGLIARTVFAKPDGGDTLKIMTGGFIDMEEIVAGYGEELSSEAVQALCGIHFYKEGVCIPTGGSGGGDDSQKWKEETSTQLFSETVNTETHEFGPIDGEITYTHTISADTIVVNFNGENYTCPVGYADGVYYYGAPLDPNTGSYVFTDFPFAISSGADDGGNYLATESPGSYTVSVSTENITYTDAFKNGVMANATMVVNFTPSGEGEYTADKTNNDIINAFYSGRAIIGYIIGETTYGGYAGIPFSIERVITDIPTPEISFNALVVISGTPWIHRLSSFSDETGDGYEMMEIELTTTTGGN